jgi:hypothetical protein
MLLEGLPDGFPASYRVAVFAARPKLLPVHIGMAVGTVQCDVAEDQLAVAAAASHPLVHAPQREFRFGVVVELRRRADRRPARRRVAVLAGGLDRPVGVLR